MLQPSFVDARAPGRGTRLYLLHPPQGQRAQQPRGAVLYVHPFAEEMNKSRRMAALTSRALADAGFAVLQLDLHGCGDSSGDFGQASWQGWVDDVLDAARWLSARFAAPLWLWGLRSGALLAREAALRLEQPAHLLLWQPVIQGRQQMQWMLRMIAAAHWADGSGKLQVAAARAALAEGLAIESGGYEISAPMAAALEAARLDPVAPLAGVPGGSRLVWLDLSATAPATPSPAAAAAVRGWAEAGWQTQLQTVAGPAFWHATEVEDAPELVSATVAALLQAPAARHEAPASSHAAQA